MTKIDYVKLRQEEQKLYKETYSKYNWTKESETTRELYEKEFKKYDLIFGKDNRMEFGDWFLFEISENRYINGGSVDTLHYPKLGIFVSYLPCDQTIEVEYVEYRKSWELRLANSDDKETSKKYYFMFEQRSEIKSHIDWSDQMYIYGVWKSKPDWKEIRKSFQKTQWYFKSREERRDYRLNQLLK